MNIKFLTSTLFKPAMISRFGKGIASENLVNNLPRTKAATVDIDSFKILGAEDHWEYAKHYTQKSKESAIEAKTALFKIPHNLSDIGSQSVAAVKSIPTVGGGLFAAKLGVSLMPNFLLKSFVQVPVNCMLSNPFLTTLGLMGFQMAKEPKYLQDTTENVRKVLYHTPASAYYAGKAAQEAIKATTMSKEHKTLVSLHTIEGYVNLLPAKLKADGVYDLLDNMKVNSPVIGTVNAKEVIEVSSHFGQYSIANEPANPDDSMTSYNAEKVLSGRCDEILHEGI